MKSKQRKLSYAAYYDRVLGAWIGKSLGGIVGAPVEGHKILGHFTAENCWPPALAPNDDLDIQVVWLEMLEEHGPDFGYDDLVRFWQDRCWYNFAEYGYFLYNVQRGIHPPLSGDFNNTYYKESMGCPIRSEIWSLVAPGNPRLAAAFAHLDGTLDHVEDSVWSEQFWAACGSEAFFSSDLKKVLEAGRGVIPRESDIFRISIEVESLFKQKLSLKEAWTRMVRNYGNNDFSKVHINFAFTLACLYLGQGNVKDTIVAAINLGWDADCTAATAAALLGIMHGSKSMPHDWMAKMGKNLFCDVAVRHKSAPLEDFARDTCLVGLEIMKVKNRETQVSAVPLAVDSALKKIIQKRAPEATVEMTATYPQGPALYKNRSSEIVLSVQNRTSKKINGTFKIEAAPELGLPEKKYPVSLGAKKSKLIRLHVTPSPKGNILWDKNLFTARWEGKLGSVAEKTFGFSGSRQWKVYGPYWDIWDTRTADVCPFRNEKVINNPHHLGCGEAASHQYVRLDKPYLDEATLIAKDIPTEDPFTVEAPEDFLLSNELTGFHGESVYYFVRTLVSKESVTCKLAISSSAPFTAWLNGKNILTQDRHRASSPFNSEAVVTLTRQPARLVIKVASEMNDFSLRTTFIKLLKEVYGDKTRGVSFLIDSLGEVL